jgi:hypothetical protein
MGYGRSAQAPTLAKMSQAFRSLVLFAHNTGSAPLGQRAIPAARDSSRHASAEHFQQCAELKNRTMSPLVQTLIDYVRDTREGAGEGQSIELG